MEEQAFLLIPEPQMYFTRKFDGLKTRVGFALFFSFL